MTRASIRSPAFIVLGLLVFVFVVVPLAGYIVSLILQAITGEPPPNL